MKDELRLALVQTDLAWQDAKSNLALLETRLEACTGNTDLLILPEMFTSAFDTSVGAIAESHPGPTLEWMQQQAVKLDTAITGSIAVIEKGLRFNRLLFVTPDGNVECYDKCHLFRMLGEDRRYSAGQNKIIIEYQGWRILPMICYDLRFPVFSRYTKEQAYDLMLVVANWPAPRTQHWRTLLQARAIENLAYVAGVNRVGSDGNKLHYDGYSVVIDPQGNELIQAGSQEGIYSTSISMQTLNQWRQQFPAWMDADSFSLNCINS